MYRRNHDQKRPRIESLEGRKLTTTLTGQSVAVLSAEVSVIAKSKPKPPPPRYLKITLSDILVSS